MSGFAILEYIRNQHLMVPTVVITANPLYHDVLHITGIHHVLIKPFHIDELLTTLHSIRHLAPH